MGKKVKKSNAGKPQSGESVQGYFRKVFAENPKLLTSRSNDELLKRWLADHPGYESVPANIKANLSNVKSVLRSKGRKRRARKAAEESGPVSDLSRTHVDTKQRGRPTLAALEEAIDDCMTIAKVIDRDGLDHIIGHLRRARNEVVWKMGK